MTLDGLARRWHWDGMRKRRGKAALGAAGLLALASGASAEAPVDKSTPSAGVSRRDVCELSRLLGRGTIWGSRLRATVATNTPIQKSRRPRSRAAPFATSPVETPRRGSSIVNTWREQQTSLQPTAALPIHAHGRVSARHDVGRTPRSFD